MERKTLLPIKKVITIQIAPGGTATVTADNVIIEIHGVTSTDGPRNVDAKYYSIDTLGNMTPLEKNES